MEKIYSNFKFQKYFIFGDVTLDLFLIMKGHMGNNLSLSLLLVSLVFLSHFFYHILLFHE
jgi:hypothetical protein